MSIAPIRCDGPSHEQQSEARRGKICFLPHGEHNTEQGKKRKEDLRLQWIIFSDHVERSIEKSISDWKVDNPRRVVLFQKSSLLFKYETSTYCKATHLLCIVSDHHPIFYLLNAFMNIINRKPSH